MFLAVWVLYAADRLLDTRSLDIFSKQAQRRFVSREAGIAGGTYMPLALAYFAADVEERHVFHHRHRRVFRFGIAVACLCLTMLVPELGRDALQLYLALASALFGYFILIHMRGSGAPGGSDRIRGDRVPKELAVGVFFCAATFVPTFVRDIGPRLVLLPQALVFASLLIVNCLFIYAWEHPGNSPRTHPATRLGIRFLPGFATAGVVISLVGAMLPLSATARRFSGSALPWQFFLACAAAFLLLLICNACRNRLTPTTLRAAADLSLLTPVLLLPLLHS